MALVNIVEEPEKYGIRQDHRPGGSSLIGTKNVYAPMTRPITIDEAIEMNDTCKSGSHYVNLIIYGECYKCGRVWGLDNDDF
jgi:hypothetical protein